MSAGWLLLGLLALAFVGSSLARGRGVSGFGLPSGSEWLIGGILVGPQILGLVQTRGLEGFEPLMAVGSAWIALSTGQRLAVSGGGASDLGPAEHRPGYALGFVVAFVTATVIAVPSYWALTYLTRESLPVRVGSALYLGVALAGSTRQLLDWAIERLGARGPLTEQLKAVIGSGELLSLLGTVPLTVLVSPGANGPYALVVRSLLPIVLGLVLGTLGARMLRVEFRVAETWAILLGILLLSVGLSMRLGTSVIATGFVLGWALGRDKRTGRELYILVQPTEGTVILPLLVVAGAKVNWLELHALGWIVAGAVLVRILAKFASVHIWLHAFSGDVKGALPLGAALSSSGETAILLGVSYWLLVRGELGQLVLATAVVASFSGEYWGAWGIRSALSQARELTYGGFDTARRSSRPPPGPREPA